MNARAQARPMPLLPPVIRTFLPLSSSSMSVRRDAFRLDYARQALCLLGDVRAGLVGGGDEGVEGLRLELLGDLLRLGHFVERGIEARHDRRRRLRRREQRLPLRELEAL